MAGKYKVTYGAENDGPKVRDDFADKKTADAFADAVEGTTSLVREPAEKADDK